MKNNKGFTTIELVATFTLTMVIVVLLLQIVLVLKDLYIRHVVVNSLRIKQAIMTEKINDVFRNKVISHTTGCSLNNCINFVFMDGSNTNLHVNKEDNTISFGDFKTSLAPSSSFGEVSMQVYKSPSSLNSYLSIIIPVSTPLSKGDFGINVLYQFKHGTASIESNHFNSKNETSALVLLGSGYLEISSASSYVEPGWRVFKNNSWYDLDQSVVRKINTPNGKINEVGNTSITYTYLADDGILYSKERIVNVSVAPSLKSWSQNNDTDFHKKIYRSKIKKVVIEQNKVLVPTNIAASLDGGPTYWDISKEGNNSIMAYLENHPTYTDSSKFYILHIRSEKNVIYGENLNKFLYDFDVLEDIDFGILSFDRTNDMSYMLADNDSLSNITPLLKYQVFPKVGNMSYMLANNPKLDFSMLNPRGLVINAPELINMVSFLANSSRLDKPPYKTKIILDTPMLKNIYGMFQGASFSCLEFSTNAPGIDRISNLFNYYKDKSPAGSCTLKINLSPLGYSSLQTNSCRYFNSAFSSMRNVDTLDLSHFSTTSAEDMSYMFYDSSSLTNVITNPEYWNPIFANKTEWKTGSSLPDNIPPE